MHLRLSDPAYAERLRSFLADVGVAAEVPRPGTVELPPGVDGDELAVYLRVWGVLHPGVEVEPAAP